MKTNRQFDEPHKVVICGSRNYQDYRTLKRVLDQVLQSVKVGSIISGGCTGTDLLAKRYALENNIIFCEVTAEWFKFGKGAGILRNKQMALLGTSTIGFWDGRSNGTYNMLKQATDHGHEYVAYYHTEKGYLERLGKH